MMAADEIWMPDIHIRLRTPEEAAAYKADLDARFGQVMFVCAICNEAVRSDPTWHTPRHKEQREPICRHCIRTWGMRDAGPVFNRANYWALGQLKAMTNRLQWEIRNGRR